MLARSAGDEPRATQLVHQALDMFRRGNALETAQAATCLTLSGALALHDRPADARRDLERALATREHLLGPESAEVADTLNALGLVDRLQGRLKEAERSYRRALAIQRMQEPTAALGTTLHNLAQLAVQRGRSKEALGLFREAIEIWERLDPQHPGLATALNQAGFLAKKDKRYGEAIALLERAGTPEAFLNLGAVHLKQTHLDESVRAYRKAVELLTEQWGPDDTRLAKPLDQLAFVLREAEEYADAAEAELRATRIRTVNALRGQ